MPGSTVVTMPGRRMRLGRLAMVSPEIGSFMLADTPSSLRVPHSCRSHAHPCPANGRCGACRTGSRHATPITSSAVPLLGTVQQSQVQHAWASTATVASCGSLKRYCRPW